MKIKCSCGSLIPDISNNLRFKAHFIPDRQWSNYWDSIDKAIENVDLRGKEDNCMELRIHNPFRSAWECYSCGKIHIEKSNGDIFSYSSDLEKYNEIFSEE